MNQSGTFPSGLQGFADVDPQAMQSIIAAGSDIALLITAEGIVQAVYLGPDTMPANDVKAWSGAGIHDLVTEESRPKITDMLARARVDEAPRWREINHPGEGGEDFPVRYAAIKNGELGGVILLGRDLRMVAQLHKRLIQAQLTMEQDYERTRQIETRYRVLFETTHEALLIVSSETGRIIDANSAAARMFSREVQDLTDRVFANRFDAKGQADLAAALALVRENGRERALVLRSRGDNALIEVDVLLFRSVNETLFLCRLTPRGSETPPDAGFEQSLASLYGRTSDAMVFTDVNGLILHANTAFLGLADVAISETLRSASIGDFFGKPGVDISVMMANARANGRLSVYSTTFRSAFGVSLPVEISTTYLPDSEPVGYAFTLRDVSRSMAVRGPGSAVSSESVEHIIELVGSTPLKELVRGTTDVVEKLCIETAIQLTNNNRASAAEMLGLSRQSLYVKLRKHGLIDQEE